MSISQKTYVGALAVFVLSLGLFFVLPSGEFIQLLAAIPLVGSLVAVLVQTLRDQVAHDRALTMFAAEKLFTIGASSHMANIAFDKHVQFSEEYAKEVHETLMTLSREGPTENALRHATNLYILRQKHAVWLTVKLEADLELFESALRKLGSNAYMVKSSPGAPKPLQLVKAMYKNFADVMGADIMGSNDWEGEELSEERAISAVIRRLRGILGTEELAEMRSAIIARSMQELRQDG